MPLLLSDNTSFFKVGVPGSARLLIALHNQLVEKEKYAVCQVVRTAASAPRLVAVVPQEEVIDETNQQVNPPSKTRAPPPRFGRHSARWLRA